MRTADGYSKTVSAGNGMFTLLGFMGMYTVLGILFLFLVRREIEQGPEAGDAVSSLSSAAVSAAVVAASRRHARANALATAGKMPALRGRAAPSRPLRARAR